MLSLLFPDMLFITNSTLLFVLTYYLTAYSINAKFIDSTNNITTSFIESKNQTIADKISKECVQLIEFNTVS